MPDLLGRRDPADADNDFNRVLDAGVDVGDINQVPAMPAKKRPSARRRETRRRMCQLAPPPRGHGRSRDQARVNVK
jgi:hypothetical protein